MEKKTYITPELLETVVCPTTIMVVSEGWAIDNDGDPNNIIVIGEDDSGDDEFIDLD